MNAKHSFALATLFVVVAIANAQVKNCDALPVREYARYQAASGDQWTALVVPAKTSRECVLNLIRKLHQQEPKVHFEIFDADEELAHYVRWAKAPVREQDSLFYPEKWMQNTILLRFTRLQWILGQ